MYLIPNKTFSKKGLSGGKITSKKDEYLKLSDSDIKVMEKNIPFLKQAGIVVDSVPEVVEDAPKTGKSEARIALEKEASEFGIEFKARTSNKDLESAIEAKKAETVNSPEFEELIAQAKELDIDTEGVSFEDLTLLVEDKLK